MNDSTHWKRSEREGGAVMISSRDVVRVLKVKSEPVRASPSKHELIKPIGLSDIADTIAKSPSESE